ncbi:hypothetical protein SAMN05443549_103118 [Flavobacterium fluvii]|uniref:Uncharacterized protein n=1 Tax=Flavobacterium fluvii TaxID=468056 RepID=A0A1M5IK80_9FLAO|nr:hypothetical protein SAMN05443549_103118 [Flavobacterium fluvii]
MVVVYIVCTGAKKIDSVVLQLLNGIEKAISVGEARVSKSCFFRLFLSKTKNRKWILSKLYFIGLTVLFLTNYNVFVNKIHLFY